MARGIVAAVASTTTLSAPASIIAKSTDPGFSAKGVVEKLSVTATQADSLVVLDLSTKPYTPIWQVDITAAMITAGPTVVEFGHNNGTALNFANGLGAYALGGAATFSTDWLIAGEAKG